MRRALQRNRRSGPPHRHLLQRHQSKGIMRFLCEGPQPSTTIFRCRDAQVRAPRSVISDPSKHERAHFVGPLVKVLVCSSFQHEGLSDPLRIDHGAATVRSHCSHNSESACFPLAQLSELGLIRIAAVFPAPPHELPTLEVRAAVAEVPPAPSSRHDVLTVDAQALLRYHCELLAL